MNSTEINTSSNNDGITHLDNNIFDQSKTIPDQTKPLSKNQLKKLKRQMEWENKKQEIKKFKKEKKKEKKAKQTTDKPKDNDTPKVQMLPRKVWEQEFSNKVSKASKIIIDCSYEDLMTEKDLISMSRQIAECYSINRKSKSPLNLILYGVGTKLYGILHKNHAENWKGITILRHSEYNNFKDYADKHLTTAGMDKIYYLTADSENEINEIKEDCTYIIGGLVDRNKHKNISLNRAREWGINHGRLPIGEYLKLNSSKVLTTNHVFSILSHFVNNLDWKEAFMSIIPKRKLE